MNAFLTKEIAAMRRRTLPLLLLLFLTALTCPLLAQNQATPVPVQFTTPVSSLVLVPLSATAAVNTQTTLTIPAPAGGLFNYVCYLAYQINQDATGTLYANAVSTSTNFNAFAVKFSQPATVNTDSNLQVVLNSLGAVGGCPKSTSPGTATTFVGPVANVHAAWTWYTVYFQAP